MVRVGWELFLGCVWTGLLLLPLAFLLDWLGLISLDSGLHRPQRFVNAPYYPGGIWAVVADLAAGALVVVVAGLAIHGQVLRRTGYEIPRWILIGTLALTGWLPYLGLHLLPMSTFVAFLATVLVARLCARPTRAERPERAATPNHPDKERGPPTKDGPQSGNQLVLRRGASGRFRRRVTRVPHAG